MAMQLEEADARDLPGMNIIASTEQLDRDEHHVHAHAGDDVAYEVLPRLATRSRESS